jgi:formylglycine-generating enzyme required for sulfatase activity
MADSGLEPQDLSSDALLQDVMLDIGGRRQPVLGGMPLLAKIGSGRDGAVYRAVHPDLGCPVAVQVLAVKDKQGVRYECMRTELAKALRIKSPRLVEIHRVDEAPGLCFVVSEFVPGKSAEKHLRALRDALMPGFPEAPAVDACIAAADGLAEAHAHGVLHLDLRPSSILIPAGATGDALEFSTAKLTDMGLAYNEFTGFLLAGTLAETGTPGFMSPEQASGSQQLTPATDVFSLGAVLYCLLTGQAPFDGPSVDAMLAMTPTEEPPELRTWRPDVSRATLKVISICLRKSPSQRFPDARVLHQALLICRDARGGLVDAQTAAEARIEALAGQGVEAQPEPAPVEPAPAPVMKTRPALSAFSGAKTAAPPPPPPAEALEATLITASPPTAAVDATPPDESFDASAVSAEDRDLSSIVGTFEETPPAPKRSRAPLVALAAVLVLAAAGAGAWKMGYLDQYLKPKGTQVARVQPPGPATKTPGPDTPQPGVGEKKEPDKTAVQPPVVPDKKADAERLAAEAKTKADAEKKAAEERARADAEAKAKADQERLAAEAKIKADAEKKAAEERARADEEAKAKAEQERVAAEARVKAEAEKKAAEERARADEEAKAKAEQERVAAEARAKAEAEKKAAEERARAEADAKAKAEQERLAAEARAKKESEEKRATEAKLPPPPPEKEVTVELAKGVPMQFVLAPAGSFMMGSDRRQLKDLCKKAGLDEKDYADELPAHPVKTGAFYIAKTPVTVAQFRTFADATGYKTTAEKRGEAFTLKDRQWQRTPGACWRQPGFDQADDHPVVLVSCRDGEAFAAWAAKQAGRALRLPTEAEWEYAARGPQNARYPWGDEWDGKLANHADQRLANVGMAGGRYSTDDDGYAFTAPVGAVAGQSWCGALGMAGNVFQWCTDVYEAYPEKASAPRIIVENADSLKDAPRVLRGGSYLLGPMDCRAAVRRSCSPRAASVECGLRIVFSAQ